MTKPKEVIQWDELPVDEQRVLTSAMEGLPLSFLVLDWAVNEDRAFNEAHNNRGRWYAEALIPAAVRLIDAGIVGVVTKDPELRQLSRGEALAVVRDLSNWWRYRLFPGFEDPTDLGPPDVALIADDSWRSPYTLIQVDQDRFTLSSWKWPPRMDLVELER